MIISYAQATSKVSRKSISLIYLINSISFRNVTFIVKRIGPNFFYLCKKIFFLADSVYLIKENTLRISKKHPTYAQALPRLQKKKPSPAKMLESMAHYARHEQLGEYLCLRNKPLSRYHLISQCFVTNKS